MTHPRLPLPPAAPELEAARDVFAAFIHRLDAGGRPVALHDVDADGISAGAVWQRAMERLGFANFARLMPDRQRNARTIEARARIEAARPDALFVLDLGSSAEPIVPGVPTCFIDHHHPDGVPPGDVLLSAYTWDPIPTTSLLCWELCRTLVDVSDLDWIAAIGVVGDLGERAPFKMLEDAKKKYTAKYLKEAAALINAPRRSATFDPEIAARALLSHSDPRSLVNSDSPDVAGLKAARDEVAAAMAEGKKAAPVFSNNVALVRLRSSCQIHPLIAQIWRRRLPKYIVIVANDGYLPGRVNFSARAAAGTNVLQFLRAQEIGEGEGSFGHGHDQASGGSLPVDRWHQLLEKLGFSTE